MESLQFKTLVSEAGIFGLSKFLGVPDVDVEDNQPTAQVEWMIEPDIRKDGIEGMPVVITRISCTIDWSCYYADCTNEEVDNLKKMGGQHNRNEKIEGRITIDSTLQAVSIHKKTSPWTVKDEDLTFTSKGCIAPKDVAIDLQTFTIEIS